MNGPGPSPSRVIHKKIVAVNPNHACALKHDFLLTLVYIKRIFMPIEVINKTILLFHICAVCYILTGKTLLTVL